MIDHESLNQKIEARYKELIDEANRWRKDAIEAAKVLAGYGVSRPRVSIGKIVEDLVKQMDGDFTSGDIYAIAKESQDINKASIYSTLFNLRKRGIIERVKRGDGRTPSIYRRAV